LVSGFEAFFVVCFEVINWFNKVPRLFFLGVLHEKNLNFRCSNDLLSELGKIYGFVDLLLTYKEIKGPMHGPFLDGPNIWSDLPNLAASSLIFFFIINTLLKCLFFNIIFKFIF